MRPLRRSGLNEGMNVVLAASIALLLFNAWFLYFNFERVSEGNYWVDHTWSVLSELDHTLIAMDDAETGVRGFAMSADDGYLEPYRRGRAEVWGHVNNVQSLTVDNAKQVAAVPNLRGLVTDRLKILDDAVTDLRLQHTEKTRESLREHVLRDGKGAMDALRAQVASMKNEETGLLKVRTATVTAAHNYFYWSLALTTLVAVLVISISLVQIRANQFRVKTEADKKDLEARLQRQVAELAQRTVGDVSMKHVARLVLEYVAQAVQALGATIYIREDQMLKRLAVYGGETLGPRSAGPDTEEIAIGEGLLGEAIEHDRLWQVTDIPEQFFKVTSSLGRSSPTVLSFLPFRSQGRTLGVIELATFKNLTNESEQLLAQISETVGIALAAAQGRDRVQLLLEETQRQSEELFTQQEELRTTNEELEQQARALETQQQSLSYKNEELERTQADIEGKAKDLIRANQYKSEFLAKMSHELRTPLNSLLILSTLLVENKERNLTDQQREFAKSIYGAGNDLLNLINDILDLSKIEARKLSLRPETFSLKSLFEQIASTFRPQADARKLDYKTALAAELESVKIHTDRQRLEQILRNFLSNALKFTEKGSITFGAKALADGKSIELFVADTGVGIPRSKIDLIFEAFEQADSSVSRKYGGTGLGLTISRELAALLGGEIRVESEEEKGSRFTLVIPIEGSISAESGRQEPRSTESSFMSSGHSSGLTKSGESSSLSDRAHAPNGAEEERLAAEARKAVEKLDKTKKSILIVEDEETFRAAIAEAVQGYGFQPIEAGDGELALEIMKAFTPSAILLDIKLPGISGMGVLEITKQMPRLRHVPVHMISALEFQQNSFRLGALGYLTKPVTIDKVRAALSRIENLITKNVKKLLIVEDDERQLGAIKELVSGADVDVLTSSSGKDALEVIKREGLDCIILDLTLPDLSGFEFLNSLNDLDISLPPIVIYTGKELTREESEGLRKYSESIIIKGARSPERLLDEVNLFLHRVESLLPEAKREMLSHMRSEESSFDGKTILIVDDDLRNVFALTSALEAKGLTIKIARNGLEALDAVQADDKIDVVLMDLMMPKMDGLEAIRRLRAMPAYKNLPIIALTAKAMKEDQEKCIEAGANDYLPKPINLSNLNSVLKVWLAPKGIFS